MNRELDLTGPLPDGALFVEASAGTGKTYALTALATRILVEHGILPAELLVVTFTRAAASELRDRARAVLVEAQRVLATGQVPPRYAWMHVLLDGDDDERTLRRVRADQAVGSFDDASITTIHGYCQQALRQLGLRAGTRLGSQLVEDADDLIDEVCRDLLVAALADDPTALSWHAAQAPHDLVTPARVLAVLIDAVRIVLTNPGATAVPRPGEAHPSSADRPERLERWTRIVHAAVAEVHARREARQQLGYDDLVTGLADAIGHPSSGAAVVDALRARHRRVLVDEFQDTDPLQWRIFRQCFADRLVVVGDPKQAIYRFRGADVHAYLEATREVELRHLATNRRSDADLVTATNTLVAGVHLGHERIVAAPVQAAPDAPARALDAGAPLQVRWLGEHPSLTTGRGQQMSVPLARHAVLADLVALVVDMLDHQQLRGEDGEQPLHPGHLAVLVPTHGQAEETYDALTAAGVPAVRTRTGSVLLTPALAQWRLLLTALERPSHAPSVRAAALGAFLRTELSLLDPEADGSGPELARLQQRCAELGDRLAGRSLLAWYDRLRAECGLVPRLLAEPGGERQLTDLDHVAELLAAELGARATSAAAVRRCLEALAGAAEREADAQMRRIDSDTRAVQISTLHASKGLQYPVVLLPFSWTVQNNPGPLVFQGDEGRLVDIAHGQGWLGVQDRVPGIPDTADVRKHLADLERRGDNLRLLYVGLTRAQHRTVLWWSPARSASAGLTAVLFDRDPDGVAINTPARTLPRSGKKPDLWVPKFSPGEAEVVATLDALERRGGGTISVTRVDPEVRARPWGGRRDEAEAELAAADPRGRHLFDRAWRRWSFTGLVRTRAEDPLAALDSFAALGSAPDVGGGLDEPDGDTPDGDRAASQPELPPANSVRQVTRSRHFEYTVVTASLPEMPLATATAGAAFGTFVHAVLEHVDPTSADLDTEVGEAVDARLRLDRIHVDRDALVAGLVAALRTSLGPLAADRRLVDIAPADRLTEVAFDLPLRDTRARLGARAIGDVLVRTLAATDPLRDYAAALAAGRFDVDLAGYLQGSIDAVLRVPYDSTRSQRFLVVDYKSNRLHDPDDDAPLLAYHPQHLVAAMEHGDYPLQAMLYTVALHRYLRWRLPGYDPGAHLGGIAYLFVRGMVGADTPRYAGQTFGVFAWRPPVATVLGLDHLLATGEVAA